MTSFINDNGREIQISEDVLITRQVASIKDFKIKGDVSVSFTVPNNSENRKTLGYYGLNQLDSPVFSDTSFNLVKNGNILMRGLMVIEEDTGDELSLYFISGNSNWFNLFQFNCRDLRNTNYSTRWGSTSIQDSVGKTKGIVFPLIDWMYKGQKGDMYWNYSTQSGLDGEVFYLYDYFPCLYVHTLFEELAKFSGVKIGGTLLSDKFFKTLIFTPDSPDIYDPETQNLLTVSVPDDIYNLITVQAIAPNQKAIEIIKWACVTFGVIPLYDTFSNTLTLDVLDKKVLQGDDWSSYVQGYTIKYDQVENNIIRIEDPTDTSFDSYNSVNDIKFGELNITSSKNDGQSNEVYTSPFPPCFDTNDNRYSISIPYIPMYELKDEDGFDYTAVTSVGYSGTDSYIQVDGIGFPFDSEKLGQYIVRIKDDNGYYDGYRRVWTDLTNYNSNTTFTAFGPYNVPTTSTGKVYTQSVSKGNPGTRVLSFIPSISTEDISNLPAFESVLKSGNPRVKVNLTNAPTAYYYKPYYNNVLDQYRQGLSYGYIDGYNDFGIDSNYYTYINGMVVGPTIKTTMLLPDKVFSEFNFDFIYLNTGRLNGYYFVNSIVNYKDSVTPVEVNLLQLVKEREITLTGEIPVSNYTISSDPGVYSYVGTSVTLTPLKLDIEIDLYTIYGSTFKATYNSVETKQLSRTNTGITTGQILYSGSIDCTVTKTGNTSGDTSITWFKNLSIMNSVNLGTGVSVNETYTFTGLTSTDDLMVEIYEE
jgi:hypothetical protein